MMNEIDQRVAVGGTGIRISRVEVRLEEDLLAFDRIDAEKIYGFPDANCPLSEVFMREVFDVNTLFTAEILSPEYAAVSLLPASMDSINPDVLIMNSLLFMIRFPY